MAAAPPVVNLISQGAASRGLDPAAVLAVAGREGLGGGVGDSGTSFGPFQLHQGGALPSGIPLSSAERWAMSPAGIGYALDRIAQVARGLHGRAAIQAIVSQFERPANPGREIAGAASAYGLPTSGPASSGFPMTPGMSSNLAAILNMNNAIQGLDLPPIPSDLVNPAGPQAPLPGSAGGGGYVSPVAGAHIQRVDQGQDMFGRPGEQVSAIGNARVDAVKSDPGGFGQAVYYTLTSGPLRGQQVYVGHALPTVRPGQTLRAGQSVAQLLQHPLGNATVPGWTEVGFARGGAPTGNGQAFADFLRRRGLIS